MRFACYKGRSRISRAIRFLTRSEYSHIGLLLDDGRLVEAWDGAGVRITANLSDAHTPGTEVDVFGFAQPLTPAEGAGMRDFLFAQVGQPYDWRGVFRFVTRRNPGAESDWFCSELAFQAALEGGRLLFNGTAAWEVPPDWIPRSTALRFEYRTITV
jgi:uncharacterized protein YycO